MKTKPRALVFLSLAVFFFVEPCVAQPSQSPEEEGFKAEAGYFRSVASGAGSTAAEAEDAARKAALQVLFAGLGKDALFAELFAAAPPEGLAQSFETQPKDTGGYSSRASLRVDDESVRIIERGPYLAAAISLLDKAEAAADEAEARKSAGADAETAADLSTALGQYGLASDSSRSAMRLIEPLADPGIFSTRGKRTSPELKKVAASILSETAAAIERVEMARVAQAADAAIAKADAVKAFLDESAPVIGDVGSYGKDRLLPLRDRLDTERRSVADSVSSLDRAQASLPQDGTAYAQDRFEFARSRLATADSSLVAAIKTIDQELRDPAAKRAARAEAFRWVFLHEPMEYLSVRGYLPYSIATGQSGEGLATALEGRAALEGAFAFGSGGVWLRSRADYSFFDLAPEASGGDERAFTQSFDFGIWSKGLVFLGYSWDWLREIDGASSGRDGSVEVGLGGVYRHGEGKEPFYKADWLLALSYDLPYQEGVDSIWNYANAGLEAQFRLGKIALFEASASQRLARLSSQDYRAVLRWSAGLGLRLPFPFALGVEYGGACVTPLAADGSFEECVDLRDGRFRFYLQYSL